MSKTKKHTFIKRNILLLTINIQHIQHEHDKNIQ